MAAHSYVRVKHLKVDHKYLQAHGRYLMVCWACSDLARSSHYTRGLFSIRIYSSLFWTGQERSFQSSSWSCGEAEGTAIEVSLRYLLSFRYSLSFPESTKGSELSLCGSGFMLKLFCCFVIMTWNKSPPKVSCPGVWTNSLVQTEWFLVSRTQSFSLCLSATL